MYTPRVELALATVLEAHGLRRRKAGRGYEVTHVTSVALITADYGCDEDTVIAALLHDTLEDTTLDPQVIRSRFGDLVLGMVRDVSEPSKPRPWRARKEAYIEQLRRTPRLGSLAIASADKIHNLTKMVDGLHAEGLRFAGAFTAGLDAMQWYHHTVYELAAARWSHPILDEHRRRMDAFDAAAHDIQSA
ncbi:MAG: HD domain-containing protein [Acidobacteria bacterium]|nr:HD domain-containing protein [Acidobacteriota bacterium]